MKTLVTALIASVALAGAASASVTESKIQSYAPNADVQSLTDAEVASLLNVINSGDSEREKRAVIASILK